MLIPLKIRTAPNLDAKASSIMVSCALISILYTDLDVCQDIQQRIESVSFDLVATEVKYQIEDALWSQYEAPF